MEPKFAEIAARIRDLREIMNFAPEEMAAAADVSVEEYLRLEEGTNDFSFTFLYRCAEKFGVDIIELLTGENPRLKSYMITRKEHGLPIKRRKGFSYYHLAGLFSGKLCEPFLVTAPFSAEDLKEEIHLSHHDGQEFDYILKGRLKVRIEDHIEYLNEGDSIIYDSAQGHGMVADGGEACIFLAVILKK